MSRIQLIKLIYLFIHREQFEGVLYYIFLNLGTASVVCYNLNHLCGGEAVAAPYGHADLGGTTISMSGA